MSEIVIRPLATMDDMIGAEEVQRVTWRMSDLQIIPAHALHAMQDSGAVLLGAFDGDRVVGFVFGVLGMEPASGQSNQVSTAQLKMYSVIAGVLPEYQMHDVGYRLKMAQRDFVIKIGIRLITWTYDPMESANGRFNIGKLGAICRRYRRHFHGDMDGINAGLQSDRFEVEWWVSDDRVAARADHKWQQPEWTTLLSDGAVLVNGASFNEAGLPVPPDDYVNKPGKLMLVEIPTDLQAIKRADNALAQRWRMHTRDIFEGLFKAGLIVTDFTQRDDENGRRHSYYLLTDQDGRTHEN